MAQVDTQVISKNDKTRGKRRNKLDWKLRSFERSRSEAGRDSGIDPNFRSRLLNLVVRKSHVL